MGSEQCQPHHSKQSWTASAKHTSVPLNEIPHSHGYDPYQHCRGTQRAVTQQ